MKTKFYLVILTLLFLSRVGFTAIPTPLPGNGTSLDVCDVGWNKDIDPDGNTTIESLRQRLELYNQPGEQSLCRFLIFFPFKDSTITLKKPLVLENNRHDRGNGTFTGTTISGYGTEGSTEKLNITLDAVNVTKDVNQCAFIIKNGFAAKQQIHGLTLKVRKLSQAICDEFGNDLLGANTPNCPGKRGGECEFKDVTVLVPTLPPDPDTDNDGVIDSKDQCPNTPTGSKVDANGCPFLIEPPDTDGDGVIDLNDQCPNSPPGESVDTRGCTIPPPSPVDPDSDGDGVIDSRDQCPNTPANKQVDEKGCEIQSPPSADPNSNGGNTKEPTPPKNSGGCSMGEAPFGFSGSYFFMTTAILVFRINSRLSKNFRRKASGKK